MPHRRAPTRRRQRRQSRVPSRSPPRSSGCTRPASMPRRFRWRDGHSHSARGWGPTTPTSASGSTTWRCCTRRQGRYAEAEPLYKRALAIGEKALGPDHPDVGTSAQQPGAAVPWPGPLRRGRAALQAQPCDPREGARARPPRRRHPAQQPGAAVPRPGPLRRGRAALQARLAIGEKALGPDHPDVGIRLNNLAQLYHGQGRYAEAEPLYKRGLAITEKALGPDHPDVGIRLNNLALLYHDQGRYAEAEPLYKRAWRSPRRRWDPTTPTSASGSTTWRCCTGSGPLRRGRAALQARTCDQREGAGARPPRRRHRAQQPGLACALTNRLGECGRALAAKYRDPPAARRAWAGRSVGRRIEG